MAYLLKSRKEREEKSLELMIRLYCKAKHNPETLLCKDCSELLLYAKKKSHDCPFGDNKPACSICPVHCYQKKERKKIKQVMHYAGPRMIYVHPLMVIDHLISKRKSADISLLKKK